MSGSMDGSELQRIRHALNVSQKEFGRLLGFGGKANNIRKTIDRMEQDVDNIGERTAEIARGLVAAPAGNDSGKWN